MGLELFEREQQGLLDDWTKGRLDEDAFKAEVRGRVLSGEVFAVYWPLLKWAGENRVKLLALNAPRKVVNRVAMKGLDALTPEERERIARDIEIGPDEYRNRVETAFKGHKGHIDLDKFFTAQVVWDETMSETLADYLRSSEGQNMRAVVIAGNEHVFRGHGVPNRVYRR